MNIGRFALGVVAAVFLSSLTDWLFMGVLFHDKYLTYPEVWWPMGATGEARTNVVASVVNTRTVGGLMALCYDFGALSYGSALLLGFGVWIVGPPPLLVVNALYIKFHPLTVVAHSLGRLAKLVVAVSSGGSPRFPARSGKRRTDSKRHLSRLWVPWQQKLTESVARVTRKRLESVGRLSKKHDQHEYFPT